MDNVKLCSLNVRGLRNGLKRRKIFQFLKAQKADIYLLQETHSTKEVERLWSNEWGSLGYFSHGSNDSRGVAVFVDKKIRSKVRVIERDMEGRYLIIKMQVEEFSVNLANVYGPNNDNPKFFDKVFEKIQQLEGTFTIIGGDLNVIMDPKLDRHCEKIYHKNSHQTINNFMTTQNLDDIWRIKHPGNKKFSWCKKEGNLLRWSHIDLFLISQKMENWVENCELSPSVLTDHSLLSMQLSFELRKRGPGIWKLNDKLLDDDILVELISQKIEQTKYNYSYMNAGDIWELLRLDS